jgi:hypothetical protein
VHASDQAILGQPNRFLLADRVADHPFGVQAAQNVPIMTFPRAVSVMQGQLQQGQNGIVDFVQIGFHDGFSGVATMGRYQESSLQNTKSSHVAMQHFYVATQHRG